MKKLLSCTALLAASLYFSGCSKNDNGPAQPAIDVTGTWQLQARLPFPETTWQPILAGDSSYYIFSRNGTYVFHSNHYHSEGVYTLSQVDGKWKLTTDDNNPPQELLVEPLSDNTIRLDSWFIGCATGYSSRKFVRTDH